MISLSYVSCAKQRFNEKELSQLLGHCHQANSALNISGLLLYNGLGTFLQMLEGEEDSILSLYENIKKDTRHHRVNCIGQRTINSRSFPNWKMGFRMIENTSATRLKGYSDFLQSKDSAEFLSTHSDFASTMLEHFKNQTQELIF